MLVLNQPTQNTSKFPRHCKLYKFQQQTNLQTLKGGKSFTWQAGKVRTQKMLRQKQINLQTCLVNKQVKKLVKSGSGSQNNPGKPSWQCYAEVFTRKNCCQETPLLLKS